MLTPIVTLPQKLRHISNSNSISGVNILNNYIGILTVTARVSQELIFLMFRRVDSNCNGISGVNILNV